MPDKANCNTAERSEQCAVRASAGMFGVCACVCVFVSVLASVFEHTAGAREKIIVQ